MEYHVVEPVRKLHPLYSCYGFDSRPNCKVLVEKQGFCFYIGKVTKKRKLESFRGTITSMALTTFN